MLRRLLALEGSPLGDFGARVLEESSYNTEESCPEAREQEDSRSHLAYPGDLQEKSAGWLVSDSWGGLWKVARRASKRQLQPGGLAMPE